jgi:hypothetical protein
MDVFSPDALVPCVLTQNKTQKQLYLPDAPLFSPDASPGKLYCIELAANDQERCSGAKPDASTGAKV